MSRVILAKTLTKTKDNWSITNVSYSESAMLALPNGVKILQLFYEEYILQTLHTFLSKHVTPVDFICWSFKSFPYWSPVKTYWLIIIGVAAN